jgi:hypothetical protein
MLPKDFDRDNFISGLRERHARILPPNLPLSVENGWLRVVDEMLHWIARVADNHNLIHATRIAQIKEIGRTAHLRSPTERVLNLPTGDGRPAFRPAATDSALEHDYV